jgi:hypothetical protein
VEDYRTTTLRISHFTYCRFIEDGNVVSLARRPPFIPPRNGHKKTVVVNHMCNIAIERSDCYSNISYWNILLISIIVINLQMVTQ